MSLADRLRRIEARYPPRSPQPWVVQVHVCHDGTSAILCYTDRPSEVLTFAAYRERYASGSIFERWTILSDAEVVDDRLCQHWPVRSATRA